MSPLVVWAHRPVRRTCPTSIRLLPVSFGLFQPCRLRSSSPGRWLVPYRGRRAGRGSRRGHGAGHRDCQQTLPRVPPADALTFATLNFTSALNRFDDIVDLLESTDVSCLTETWHDTDSVVSCHVCVLLVCRSLMFRDCAPSTIYRSTMVVWLLLPRHLSICRRFRWLRLFRRWSWPVFVLRLGRRSSCWLSSTAQAKLHRRPLSSTRCRRSWNGFLCSELDRRDRRSS
jgi:hypothetical protein